LVVRDGDALDVRVGGATTGYWIQTGFKAAAVVAIAAGFTCPELVTLLRPFAEPGITVDWE